MRYALAFALLLLTGCETAIVAGIEDARSLHESARDYVRENHEWRQTLRRICQEITEQQIVELRRAGRYEEAKDLIRKNYPQLVVPATVKQAIEDPEQLTAEPFGCQ